MSHRWEETPPTQMLGDFGRRCTTCGAKQHIEREYWWGRIVATKWRPLVGRCPGTPGERLARRHADTPEGQRIVNKACELSKVYPELTEGQLLRLAYWGVPGDA